MTARDDILGRIRTATGRTAASGAPPPPEYANAALIPARATGSPAALTERFVEMATEAAATIDRVAAPAEVGAAIAAWLDRQNLPNELAASPDPALDVYGLAAAGLAVRRGAATGDDIVSVTPVKAGIAETGSLMVTAGPDTPYTLNFLPEVHIAVLAAERIVGGYEDAWALVRQNNETGAALPRTVTLITGPSRSSDIERTVTIGVHGPKQLHIVLVGKADGEEA